jgi:hypothetical protein
VLSSPSCNRQADNLGLQGCNVGMEPGTQQ